MTPFHLRARLKAAVLGQKEDAPVVAPPPPLPRAAPPVTPTGSAAPAAPPPPVAAAPVPVAPAPVPPARAQAAPPPATDAVKKASDAEKAARHWARTRKGLLRWLAEGGGSAPMADMHAQSEAKYFIGHKRFSDLMVELTGEGLVEFGGGTVTLTEAGRAAAAP
jgi:hypothetical protein